MIAMQITAIAPFSCSKAEGYLERLAGAPANGRDHYETSYHELRRDRADGIGIRRRRARDAFDHAGNPTRRHSNLRSIEQDTQMRRNDVAEFLTDINGVPVRVRFIASNLSAVCRDADIHSLLSTMLEKAVAGARRPDRSKVRATVELMLDAPDSARLPAPSHDNVLRAGPLELDLLERTAKRGSRRIDLRPREFQLLKYMMQQSGELLTRATLLKEVWNYKFVPDTNLVDVHMGKLRRKVDGPNEPPLIRNVRGAGFVLDAIPFARQSARRGAEPWLGADDASRPASCTFQSRAA